MKRVVLILALTMGMGVEAMDLWAAKRGVTPKGVPAPTPQGSWGDGGTGMPTPRPI